MSAKQLFVGNLPFSVQWQDLKDLFREAGWFVFFWKIIRPVKKFEGNVVRADVATTPTGKSRGFGTVLLSTHDETIEAINKFNNFVWHGRKLEVREDRASSESYHVSESHHVSDFLAPRENYEGGSGRALYVGNLPFSVGWMDLKDFFRQAGHVVRAEVPIDFHGRSKGFGIVVMSSVEDARKAIG
ncbi:hypothetical protein HK096_002828, partial [Nowakowskiella sp. JEL0078]